MIDGFSLTHRLCTALHRSILHSVRLLGGRDALPDAVLSDLRLERSPVRRMAAQEARLGADALASI